jgi:hypothetical protein
MTWLHSARTIVERRTACRIDITNGHLVPDGRNRRGKVCLLDLFSAGIMLAIWESLSPENQKMFESMSVLRAQDVAMRLATKERTAP